MLALAAFLPALCLMLAFGCSTSDQLTGVPVLNNHPETRITSTPPTLDRTDILVRFRWTGHDLDGNIRGFQWKMSSNGEDGISVQDTLSFDPSTGAAINPWHFTTAMDTTFAVTADSSGFIDDAQLPENSRRFYQHHTFFVRAVDDRGAVDPSPAMVTFTAATLAPTIRLTTPNTMTGNYRNAVSLPPSFILGWTGSDPDFATGSPSKVRYLLKDAVYSAPGEPDLAIDSSFLYNQHKDDLVKFSDPGWSDWIHYESQAIDRRQSFSRPVVPPGGEQHYYLFALQAQDTAGAVSLDLSYAKTVHNFKIDGSKLPALIVSGSFFDTQTFSGLYGSQRIDIAQGQPVSFNWYGNADEYGGVIMGYRYGWDVEDVNNESDPGWQIQFGDTEMHTFVPTRTFNSGIHTLVIETRDNSEQVTRARFVLTVVPIPDVQSPVLLVDDVVDHNSNGWPNNVGRPMDEDAIRDQFWSGVLNTVDGWVDNVHEYDTQDNQHWGYREAVNYKVILWTTKNATPSYIRRNFDGYGGSFIWIESYVQNIGNLFLTGTGAVTNFHPSGNSSAPWLFPIIYDTNEQNASCGATSMAMSFGVRYVGGVERNNGLDEFGYRSLGLAMINQMVPPRFYIAENVCGNGGFQTTRRCAGTKAVILDPRFDAAYNVAGAFPDTIFVWSTITPDDDFTVGLNYDFGQQDEFYDVNVTDRRTPWNGQTMPDGSPTVVPMLRAYSRYDWILDHYLAAGDTEFPGDLPLGHQTYCGSWGLDYATGRSRVDGVTLGVLTYKTTAEKPSGKADVIWGFDPHMMEHDQIASAILWVLRDHFGLAVD